MYSLGTGTAIVLHKDIVCNIVRATLKRRVLLIKVANLAYKIFLHLEEDKSE